MITLAYGEIPGCFAEIIGIAASTCKLINYRRKKPARDRVFHAKQVAYLEGGKNLFDIQIIAITLINHYITGTLSNPCPQGSLPTSLIFYFRPPYIGHFSVVTQKKIRHFLKRHCSDWDIKLVFSSFEISNLFGVRPHPCVACFVHVWFITLRVRAAFFHTRA